MIVPRIVVGKDGKITLDFKEGSKAYIPSRSCVSCMLWLGENCYEGDSEICKDCSE